MDPGYTVTEGASYEIIYYFDCSLTLQASKEGTKKALRNPPAIKVSSEPPIASVAQSQTHLQSHQQT